MSFALLLAVLAAAQPDTTRTDAGTAILEWKNPSPDLELRYGVGEPNMKPELHTRRGEAGGRPLTVRVPLSVWKGAFWYGVADVARPDRVYEYVSSEFKCPPGGALRIEIKTMHYRNDRGPHRGHEGVTVHDRRWQQGCTFPGDTTALTAPAVAALRVRRVNPRAGIEVDAFSDRSHGNSVAEPNEDLLMQSGPGTVWVEMRDPKIEVWAVQAYRYTCEDGGRLDLTAHASIVADRPRLKVELGGTGCRVMGAARPACSSGQRRPGRARPATDACQVELPPPRCCVDAPKQPAEE